MKNSTEVPITCCQLIKTGTKKRITYFTKVIPELPFFTNYYTNSSNSAGEELFLETPIFCLSLKYLLASPSSLEADKRFSIFNFTLHHHPALSLFHFHSSML